MPVKNSSKYLLLILMFLHSHLLQASYIDENYKAICAGIEIIGVNKETADKIRKKMPLQIGDSYTVAEADKYRPICISRVKEIIPEAMPSCSFLIYGESKVYIVVDVPSKAFKNAQFRAIPPKTGQIAKLPKELVDLYEKWENRRSLLISNGNFPIEILDKDFLDYEDSVLHNLALKLSKYAYKHNDKLLDIIHYSKDEEERQRAAYLFSWARHPGNLALILKWNIFLDPDVGVRNNVARAFGFYLGKIKNEELLKRLLPTYCQVATLPGHTDRNKALYSIKRIIEAHPDFARNLDSECIKTITHISEASIIDNVGDPAKEILRIINKSNNV